MEDSLISVLLLSGSERDYELTNTLLNASSNFALTWVNTYDAGLAAIGQETYDVCLIDYALGQNRGLELLREAVANECSVPIIVLAEQAHSRVDVEAMTLGASGYLDKERTDGPLLERTIRYAIERKRTETGLAQLAQYDTLTGLANRSLFQDRLPRALYRADRNEQLVALMFLDLDAFKEINDTFGHQAGDALLKAVATRLKSCLRKVDTVARFAGDEFTIILEGIEQTHAIATIAQKILDTMASPFSLNNQEVFVTTSIGVAVYPNDGGNPEQLIHNADTAMYRAKACGGNTYRFHAEDMDTQILKRPSLECRLRAALECEAFALHYQPQVDAFTRAIVGVEALLRWQTPDGLVGPDEFIPLAEKSGMIVPIGEWVLRTACKQNRAWQQAGLPALPISVNLSEQEFRLHHLPELLADILHDTGLSSQYLALELTESHLAEPIYARKMIEQLKAAGHRIIIDDFGTGYVSLNHLKRLPIDTLKIDRSFVPMVTNNPDDAAIAVGIISLARALRIEAAVEGVETRAQLEFFRKRGCRRIQGYLLGRPMSSEDITEWLQLASDKLTPFPDSDGNGATENEITLERPYTELSLEEVAL